MKDVANVMTCQELYQTARGRIGAKFRKVRALGGLDAVVMAVDISDPGGRRIAEAEKDPERVAAELALARRFGATPIAVWATSRRRARALLDLAEAAVGPALDLLRPNGEAVVVVAGGEVGLFFWNG
jgi:hypothetical protein